MGAIRVRKDTNKLILDFTFDGVRYRENTVFQDNKTNRMRLKKLLARIENDISEGTFDYQSYFPNGSRVKTVTPSIRKAEFRDNEMTRPENKNSTSPLFNDFIHQWLQENKLAWRRSHLVNMEGMVSKYYLPAFGNMEVGSITRADLLKFRSTLTKVPGRNGNVTISNNRINKIMDPLRRIFEEAADRYEFSTPFVRIKPLKLQRSHVQPFSLEEVRLILDKVRIDYKNYYTVRFFTGMRTGEVDGLLWKYVDFDRKLILVRETLVDGIQDYTKTDSSQREIQMSNPVYDALRAQFQATGKLSKFVFCNTQGRPLEHNNVTKRVWYPMLATLKLEKRRPYQTRHTAATLWLAAGEAPEWIARQMGHSNTEMLFKVYSRFVPNLTRQDGSAFEKLLLKTNKVEGCDL